MRSIPYRPSSALAGGVLVYAGRMGRAVLGFGINVLVARWLGPGGFGLFWLFLVTVIIGQSVLGEGFDPGVVRYYAHRARHEPDRAGRVLSSALVMRLGIGVPGVLLGLVAVGWFGGTSGGGVDPDSLRALRLGIVGALGGALWSFVLTVLQARKDFATHAAATPVLNVARLIGIGVVVALGPLTVRALLLSHVVALYACALAGLWWLRDVVLGAAPSRSTMREILAFSVWTGVANVCFLAQSYLAVPVLDHLGGAASAGLFGAGATLLLAGEHLVVTILTVQLPRLSELVGRDAYAGHIRRALPWYAGSALVLSPIALLAEPIVLLVYGPAYAPAADVFRLLFIGFLATLVTHPLYLVFYAMDRPQLYTASALVSSLGWIVAAIVLIPPLGAVGAAWATLVARLAQGAVIGALLWWLLGRRPAWPV